MGTTPEWRIGEAGAAIAADGVTELSGPGWRGVFERMSFGPGFYMHLGRISTTAEVDLPVAGTDGPPLITAYTLTAGRARLRILDWPDLALEPGRAILFTPRERRGFFRVQAQRVVRFFSVALPPALVVELLDRRIPPSLAALIESNCRETVVKEHLLGDGARALINGLGEPGEGGGLQRLHREAVAIGLVTEALEAGLIEETAQDEAQVSPDDEAAVRAAREALLADLREAPPAAALAAGAGVPLRRFLRAFEAVHGASPAQLLRRARLAEAQRLLKEGQLPLKAIAWQVGYGHVSNFTAAFAEQYGAPPRRFARQRLVAE